MANPVMRESIFNRIDVTESAGTMTVNGAINKTGLLFLILVACGAIGWSYADTSLGLGLLVLGTLCGLICAITLSFKPNWAPAGAPVYAAAEGFAIGVISASLENRYPGIAGNAMVLTFGIFALMLTLYRMKVLQATERFTRVVVLATMGIALTYIVDLVMGIFGAHIGMIHTASPAGIIFSLIVSGVAAMNLIIDFGFIERATAARSPKYMEWYAGFALLVTLVWLYLELLRLLQMISGRRR